MSAFGFKMDAAPPRRSKPWLLISALLGSLIIVTFLVGRSFTTAEDFEGNGSGTAEVTIVSGDTLTKIGQRLLDAGVVASVDAWVAATSADSRATSIAPGDYNLRKEMSARRALELLLDPESRAVYKLVVREGDRLSEIVAAASKLTGISKDEFVAVLKHPKQYGLSAEANGRPEGFLFPATYEIAKDDSPADILKKMTTRWKQMMVDSELKRRAAQVGRTVEEIVIIASILEVEAGPQDYAKVARVIENRLALPTRLQLDSTVNYALGINKLRLSAAQMNTESAYNTYNVDGLPPGAIGNPGLAAIEAALTPAKGDWLYFVTVDPATKLTKFASNYDDFLKIKAEFNANNP